MSIFEDMANFARTMRRARARRRTADMLDALPSDVQKDIGWKWSPRLRGHAARASIDWDLL